MWLLNSSVGKKVIMSVTGLFLVLFLTFHACMNLVAVFSLEAYDTVCEFLGANWYALVGTAVLAGGFLLHIIFATWLSLTNKKARGEDEYAISNNAPGVEWASKNMYVLGIIIILGIVLHLCMFWAKMQLVEVAGLEPAQLPIDGAGTVVAEPAQGGKFLIYWFQKPVICIVYLLWLVAIWFHLTHGIWSAFHTLGANNNTWLKRWKCIATIYATVLMAMFAFVVIYFFVATHVGCNSINAYLGI